MTKIFIDGSAGTTGLRIADRLADRRDIQVVTLPEDLRKDPNARRDAICSAEIAFLCLPDDAAREAVVLAGDSDVKIIDTSTAHRTADDWAYGFPELTGCREQICISKRISNPGCHASGFVALARPLVENGLLAKDAELTCFSLTGYSGGGKKMIAEYESQERSHLLKAPRQYALTQQHKHLIEMAKLSKMEKLPVFCPIVADFYSGMEVTIPLFSSQLGASLEDIRQLYADYYATGLVRCIHSADPDGLLSAVAYSGRDDMQVGVFGNEDRIILSARFDNLGKGASGAAIQNMNILLGCDEATGLVIG